MGPDDMVLLAHNLYAANTVTLGALTVGDTARDAHNARGTLFFTRSRTHESASCRLGRRAEFVCLSLFSARLAQCHTRQTRALRHTLRTHTRMSRHTNREEAH